MIRSGLLGVAVALLAIGCTKAQQVQGITIGGVACDGIAVASSHPELIPLCATAEEVAQALQNLFGAKGAAITPRAIDRDALYAEILRMRAAK